MSLARAFACVLASLALVVFLAPAPVYAAEGDQGPDPNANLVDPTQRADNSFIYDTTIESLFEQASLYDERTVQVIGEVIGDRIDSLDAGGGCWITLTVIDAEDKSTISVLMSDEQASQIDRYGKYGVTGTTLQVRGTYHQTCAEHDGLPDIHATNSSVISKGIDHPDEFKIHDFLPFPAPRRTPKTHPVFLRYVNRNPGCLTV